jgi:hypothetical protein
MVKESKHIIQITEQSVQETEQRVLRQDLRL